MDYEPERAAKHDVVLGLEIKVGAVSSVASSERLVSSRDMRGNRPVHRFVGTTEPHRSGRCLATRASAVRGIAPRVNARRERSHGG